MSKRGRTTDALDDDTDVEQLLQTPGEPTALTISVVKMKLVSFSKNDRLRKVIDTIAIDFNRLMGEAYAFSNLHVLRILTSSDELDLPIIDRNFFYRCLLAVSTSNSTGLFSSVMQSSIEKFDTLRSGDATSKVDVRGYSQLLADLSIVMATMAQNHLWMNLAPRVMKYLRLGHPALKHLHRKITDGLIKQRSVDSTVLFDLTTPRGVEAQAVLDDLRSCFPLPMKSKLDSKKAAHYTLPLYFRILSDTEFVTGDASTPTPYKTRTFDLLPTKSGFTMSHIPISNMTFMAILNKTGLETLYGDGRHEDSHALWAKYFNLNAVETQHRRFDHRIITDGYSVSIQMQHLTSRTCDVACGCLDKQRCVEKMRHGARVVGVDPGFTDVVTISEKDQPPKRFSSAEYYERALFFRSARKTRRWNENTLEDVSSLPSSKTSDLEKLESHCRRYIEALPRITKHRATKGYRAMRFTRYIYRAKAIDAICDMIAPRDGKFSVVMFGDWNGGHGSPVSRKTCGPLQEIKFRLRASPHVDLRSVDEFRSSVTCSNCWARLENMRASTTKWSWRNRRMETQLRSRVHKVLHCSNSVNAGESPCCGTTWNRDVNASRNILRLGVYDAFGVERPRVFRRETNTQIPSRGRVPHASAEVEERSGTSNPVILGASSDGRSEKLSTSNEMQFMKTLFWAALTDA